MLKLQRNVALVLMALTLSACVHHIHPGALGTFDSDTYDALLTSQSMIVTARAQFKSGALPDRLKPPFNHFVDAYNAAYTAFYAWRPLAEQGIASDAKLAEAKTTIAAMKVASAEFTGAR